MIPSITAGQCLLNVDLHGLHIPFPHAPTPRAPMLPLPHPCSHAPSSHTPSDNPFYIIVSHSLNESSILVAGTRSTDLHLITFAISKISADACAHILSLELISRKCIEIMNFCVTLLM